MSTYRVHVQKRAWVWPLGLYLGAQPARLKMLLRVFDAHVFVYKCIPSCIRFPLATLYSLIYTSRSYVIHVLDSKFK